MRRPSLLLPVPLLATLALAVPASASPLPPGDYDVNVTTISLQVSLLTFTAPGGHAGVLTVPEGATGELDLPVIQPSFNDALLNLALPGLTLSMNAQVALDSPVVGHIDPSTGGAHIETTGHSHFTGDVTGDPQAIGHFDCAVASPAAPVPTNLSTAAPGSRWSASTAFITLRGSSPLPPA